MGFQIENILVKYIDEGGTDIVIPDGIAEIGYRAFYQCKSIRNVKISDSVRVIGEEAFAECENIVSLKISDNVREIKKSAFRDCTGLEYLYIPESVEIIRENAFVNDKNIKELTMFADTQVEPSAFGIMSSLKIVTIHDKKASLTIRSRIRRIGLEYVLHFINSHIYKKESIFISAISDNNKIPLGLYLAYNSESKKAHDYIKDNIIKVVKYIIDFEETENLEKIFASGYVTAENIDEMIEYAIETKKAKMQVILMNYKNDNFGFSDKFDDLLID